MKINIGFFDQLLRLMLGTIMLAWALAGGPWWAYVGLALAATAAWRFDPIYAVFRISTLRHGRAKGETSPPPVHDN